MHDFGHAARQQPVIHMPPEIAVAIM